MESAVKLARFGGWMGAIDGRHARMRKTTNPTKTAERIPIAVRLIIAFSLRRISAWPRPVFRGTTVELFSRH